MRKFSISGGRYALAETVTLVVARNLLGSSGLTATSDESPVVIDTELEFVDNPMRISGSWDRRKYSKPPFADMVNVERKTIARMNEVLRKLIAQ